MNDQQSTVIQIECYDAFGYYEQNTERILLVMEFLGRARLVKRDWVKAQAVGGSWARATRTTFETREDPLQIKAWMVGLEYRPIGELPESLHHLMEKPGLFRFADIDVLVLSGGAKRGRIRRFADTLGIGVHKVEKAELGNTARSPEFLKECRELLIASLDPFVVEKLYQLEQEIFKNLARTGPSET